MASRLANGVRQSVLKDGCSDSACGLKLFRRDLFLELPRFDHMHRFLPALMQRDGWQVGYVPVAHRPRARGVSKYGVGNRMWRGIRDCFAMRWFRARAVPARRLASYE